MGERRSTLVEGSESGLRAHQRLIDSFADELARRDPDGRHATRIGDPDQAARAAADRLLDTAQLWEKHLGGFYDTAGVRHLLARNGTPISRQAVSKRRDLLALKTGSGRVVYPLFQFADGRPVDGLADVLEMVPERLASRWTLASWLVTPQAELHGERPVDMLADGYPQPVVRAAQRWAATMGR